MKRWLLLMPLAVPACEAPGPSPGEKLLAEAKEQVARQLLDPESARFRDLKIKGKDAVCGEVNGKNRFGGYVGFQPFSYEAATKDVTIFDPEYSQSILHITRICDPEKARSWEEEARQLNMDEPLDAPSGPDSSPQPQSGARRANSSEAGTRAQQSEDSTLAPDEQLWGNDSNLPLVDENGNPIDSGRPE